MGELAADRRRSCVVVISLRQHAADGDGIAWAGRRGVRRGGQGQVAAAVEGRLRGLEERQRLLTQSVMEMDSVKSRAHKLERRYEQGWVEVGVRLCLCARSPPPTPGPST